MTPQQDDANRRNRERTAFDLAKARYDSTDTQLALMGQDIAYMKDKLDQLTSTNVDAREFKSLELRVGLVEKGIRNALWLVVSTIIVISLYALFNLHNPVGVK